MVMMMMVMMMIMSSSSSAIQLSWCTAVFVLCYFAVVLVCVCCLQSTTFRGQDGHIKRKSVQFLTQLPVTVRYCGPCAPRFQPHLSESKCSEYMFLGWKKNLFINVNYVLRCSILLTHHHIYTQCAVCINIGATAVDFYL
jgi:hypothetical protein